MKKHLVSRKATVRLNWFLMIFTALALNGCGGGGGSAGSSSGHSSQLIAVTGKAELRDENGNAYSFKDAQVKIFGVEKLTYSNHGIGNTAIGTGTVDGNNNSTAVTLLTNKIDANKLYVAEFKCPDQDNQCDVKSPLHIILNGKQLIAGGWVATVMTEVVYQELSYYVTARYTVTELQSVLDEKARDLLQWKQTSDQTLNYRDLLNWRQNSNATDVEAKRPKEFQILVADLLTGTSRSVREDKLFDKTIGDIGYADDFIAHNNYVYALEGSFTGNNSLRVNEIKPDSLSVVDTIDFSATPKIIAYSQNTLYIALASTGIEVRDISDPASPVHAGLLNITGDIIAMTTNKRFLFVSLKTGGGGLLQIYDISNPLIPTFVMAIPLQGSASAMAANADYLFAIVGSALRVVDIRSNPYLMNGFLNVTATDIGVNGNFVYLANGDINVIDASDPTRLKLIGQLHTNGGVSSIDLNQQYLFAGTPDGLQIVDIARPSSPIYLRTIPTCTTPDNFCYGGKVRIAEDKAFLSYTGDNFGIQVIDIGNVVAPALIGKLSLESNPSEIEVLGPSTILFTSKATGVDLIDASQISNPRIVRNLSYGDTIVFTTSLGKYLYIARNDGGIDTFDISNPNTPHFISTSYPDRGAKLNSGGPLVTANGHLYLFGTDGLYTYDLTNPSSPVEVANGYLANVSANNVGVGPDRLYALDGTKEISEIDITSPSSPKLIKTLLAEDPAFSMVVDGHYGYTLNGDIGAGFFGIVDLVNIDQYGNLPYVNELFFDSMGQGFAIDQGYAYIPDGLRGVQVYDISNPLKLVYIGRADTQGSASYIRSMGRYILVGTDYGLEIIRAIPGNE